MITILGTLRTWLRRQMRCALLIRFEHTRILNVDGFTGCRLEVEPSINVEGIVCRVELGG